MNCLCITLTIIIALVHQGQTYNDELEIRSSSLQYGYGEPVCPQRDMNKQRLKGCMRKCSTNKDCQNDRKVCMCDGECGMSCIRPEKECPELPDPENGQVHLTGRVFQDRAVYTCDEGYQIVGLEKVLCQASGVWSGEQPTCRPSNSGSHSPYYCGQPPYIRHANHNGSTEQTFFDLDTELSYHCQPGFKRSGFDHAKCFFMNGTAQWYGPDLTCEPIECGPAEMIMHGKPIGDCFSFRCQVEYMCEAGFVLEGRGTRICQSDGTWTPNELPDCRPVDCGIPSSPINGKALFTTVSYKSVVSYECQYGYMIRGNSTRTCESDKKWSGNMPECVEINCGLPAGGNLPNGWLEGSRTTLGEEIAFRCIEGMVVEGVSNRTRCEANGKWSHPPPKCLAPCIIPEIHNGNCSLPPGSKISHGENIVVNCTENHEAGGEGGKIMCRNGTWSHIPRCDPARCKALPDPPSNGMIVAPKTNHGAVGLYRCKDGYRLQGDNRTQCDYGKWTGRTPRCREIYCTFPGYVVNGRILLVGNMGLYDYRPYVKKITNDRQIMFDCDRGYILQYGSPQGATCVDGKWSPATLPVCEPENHPRIRWLDKRSIRSDLLNKLFPGAGKKTDAISDKGKNKNAIIEKDEKKSISSLKLKNILTTTTNNNNNKIDTTAVRRKAELHNVEGCEDDLHIEGLHNNQLKPVAQYSIQNPQTTNHDLVEGDLTVNCPTGFHFKSSSAVYECMNGYWLPETPTCLQDKTELPTQVIKAELPTKVKLPTQAEVPTKDKAELPTQANKAEWPTQADQPQLPTKAELPTQIDQVVNESFDFINRCRLPTLENGYYIKGQKTGDIIDEKHKIEFKCEDGYAKNIHINIICKDGRIVPELPECFLPDLAPEIYFLKTLPVKEKKGKSCIFSGEEENVVASLGNRILNVDDSIEHGETVLFRCSDIGKYKLVGESTLNCSNGQLSGPMPTCEGLNQLYNYALDLPPTILFRHENGGIAQSNSGDLLVYPATTLHMECLFLKKNGVPHWEHHNASKKTYPQGWAQGYMRNSGLEFRLSIYHASSKDSGDFTCITPSNSSHTINIKVQEIDCPKINVTKGLELSTEDLKLGTLIQFSCANGNRLVGREKLRCLPSQKWSGQIPSCDKIVCPDIKTIVNDSVVKISIREDGGKVYLACPKGHQMNGPTEAYCQPDSSWSIKTSPTCKPISCRNPSLSKNLEIQQTGPFNAGDVVKYQCKVGFRLEGKPLSLCSNNGKWSNPSPHCVKACTYPGAAIRGMMDTVKFYYNIGDKVNYQCSENTTMVGNSTINCLNTGLWSSDIPLCLEKLPPAID